MSDGFDERPEAGERRERLTRRRFLALGGVALAGLAGGSYLALRDEGERTTAPARAAGGKGKPHPLDDFAENVVSGGPPKDGIPPIEAPKFLEADAVEFLDDEDVVFGLVERGEARAYPQLVLVWHEIVNDSLPGGPVSVTYCPLTGSAVAFRGRAPAGKPYTFGTSGDLVNSNLLMYDRETDSRWPQILGQAITGPAKGTLLEEIPLDWTTWKAWRTSHPETTVLSLDTGHIRIYGQDPYGSYTPLGGYYEDDDVIFPLMREDPRFHPKEVFIGAKHGDGRVAARKATLRERGAGTATVAGDRVVFLYDHELDEARAYVALAGGRSLNLAAAEAGRFVDRETDSLWDASGRAIDGRLAGARLPRVLSYDVMWFAWVAFFPQTQVVA